MKRATYNHKEIIQVAKEEKYICVSLVGNTEDREQVVHVAVSHCFPTLTQHQLQNSRLANKL